MLSSHSIFGWFLVLVGVAVVVAISAGLLESYLPGGKHNPYSAATVEKQHTVARAFAYAAAMTLAFAAFVVGIWWLN